MNQMIKKVVLLLGIIFTIIIIGVGKASANTTTVKVEIVSRNVKAHTINVKTDDSAYATPNKLTLKKVSKLQMAIANKGSILKVTYDDKFNVSAIERVTSMSYSQFKFEFNNSPGVRRLHVFGGILMAIFAVVVLGGAIIIPYVIYK